MLGPRDPSNDDTGLQTWPEVIFSMANGFVWASLQGKSAPIRLGEYESVKAMMQDFLDQSALGERLTARSAGDH